MPPKKASHKQAKTEKSVQPSVTNNSTFAVVLNIVQVVFLLLLVSLASHLARIFLHPVYGSVLLNHLHEEKTFVVVVLVTSIGLLANWYNYLPNNAILLALISSSFKIMPHLSKLLMFYSGSLGPHYGPTVSMLLTFSPILICSILSILRSICAIKNQVLFFPHTLVSFIVIFPSLWWLHMCISSVLESTYVLHAFSRCFYTSWSSYFVGILSLASVFWQSISSKKSENSTGRNQKYSKISERPSWKRTLFLTTSVLIPISFGTNAFDLPQCHPGPGVHPRLHESVPSSWIRLLNRKESITGMVSVTEHLVNGQWARLLRCDHSVLGGLWTGPAREYVYQDIKESLSELKPYEIDAKVVSRAESVYAAFIVQEAVRLVDNSNFLVSSEKKPHSLIIGLGIGTCAKAFSLHGMHVSAAEIDPAVYLFARRYFGLPEPDKIYIKDAREIVSQGAKDDSTSAVRYDFISHDVFTGGSVAPFLFTMQFWDEIKKVMAPGGVIAVNYVGNEGTRPTRAIQTTLLRSFRYCRSFTDSEPGSNVAKNMVAICSNDIPIKFRKPTDADFLDSPLRERVLSNIENKEIRMYDSVDADTEYDLVLKDETVSDTFGQWQTEAAIAHWYAMRNTLGDESWMYY